MNLTTLVNKVYGQVKTVDYAGGSVTSTQMISLL